MKIWIASDHAGLYLKNELTKITSLDSHKLYWVDLGPSSEQSVDYPDFADLVAQKINAVSMNNNQKDSLNSKDSLDLKELGLLICGSGQGMCIRANKYNNVRAALCFNTEIAELSRAHNNANVLCLGARFTTVELALQILQV
ncbi:MAG: RpiB/LacA/LacB family sugar-phosphate isomerase, partial [Bdellovibrionales bacterium]